METIAVIKYDVSDVESGGGGEQPQPAMYPGKIVSVTHRTKKTSGDPANDLEVVVDVGSEYARLWTYIQLDNPASAWKLREFTDALGLPPKGGLDPAKITKEQPDVNVKVSADTDLDGNYRGRVKNLFKPGKLDASEADDEEPATDYSSWTVEDLEAEISDRGLDMPGGRKTVDKLAQVLEDDDAETGAAAKDDEPGDITAVDGYEDFGDWTSEDLKEELEKLGLKLDGRFSEKKARDAIEEAVLSTNGGAPAEEDGGEADDYDTWELQELKDEIETRTAQGAEIEVSGRQTKEKLIDALREDDKSAKPF